MEIIKKKYMDIPTNKKFRCFSGELEHAARQFLAVCPLSQQPEKAYYAEDIKILYVPLEDK